MTSLPAEMLQKVSRKRHFDQTRIQRLGHQVDFAKFCRVKWRRGDTRQHKTQFTMTQVMSLPINYFYLTVFSTPVPANGAYSIIFNSFQSYLDNQLDVAFKLKKTFLTLMKYGSSEKSFSYSIDFHSHPDDFLEPTPQVSSFCSFLSSNLGLGSLWWLSALIQLSALLPLLVLYRLCNLVPLLNFITISSIVTFYLNASLWIWSLYLILALANCGIGLYSQGEIQ